MLTMWIIVTVHGQLEKYSETQISYPGGRENREGTVHQMKELTVCNLGATLSTPFSYPLPYW
jgi:hypothetical protein